MGYFNKPMRLRKELLAPYSHSYHAFLCTGDGEDCQGAAALSLVPRLWLWVLFFSVHSEKFIEA